MSEIRHYALSTHLVVNYPWGIFCGGRALCPDGKVRQLKRISQTADTFFSVPAAVEVKGKTVAGYVTFETQQGYSIATNDDPTVVKFVPYTYRKNGGLFK